jgi:hypothetical protein
MMMLSIYVAKYFVIGLIVIGIIMYLYPIIRSKIIHLFEDIETEETYYSHFKEEYGRLLRFTITNSSNSIIECDLCDLKQGNGYTFFTSDGDYEKLKEYLKSYTLNVSSTSVRYNHKNWQKDVIKNKVYNPFQQLSTPILIAMDDFDTVHSINDNIVISKKPYEFNFFSTVLVKLNPYETKDITLLVTDEQNAKHTDNKDKVKTAITIKNNSSIKQRVNLFDDKYSNPEIEFNSIFDINSYDDIVLFFNQNPLVAKYINIYAPNTESVVYQLNFEEHRLVPPDYLQHKDFYKINLKDETFIAYFCIEVEPNQEIIVSFK